MIDDRELDKTLLTLRIIWLAMVASVFIYLRLAWSFASLHVNSSLPPEAFSTFRTILYIVALTTLIGSRYLWTFILSGKANWARSSRTTTHPALQRYTSALITCLALSDGVAVDGLVLFLMGRDTTSLYILSAASIAAMLVYRPTRQGMLETVAYLEAYSDSTDHA